jgi:hypothetical protein
MASQHQVRQYLAYWFQLGKPVICNGGKDTLLPRSVIQGDRYSPEFDTCWEKIQAIDAGDCYLEGTITTIAELLSPAWEITACCRCTMPVPMPNVGMPPPTCPCVDLPDWPNTEVPMPRSPVNSQILLQQIRDRLRQTSLPFNQNGNQNSQTNVDLPDVVDDIVG